MRNSPSLQRLHQLRRQAGATTTPVAREQCQVDGDLPQTCLKERIGRLRVGKTSGSGRCAGIDEPTLAGRLGGELLVPGLIRVRERIDLPPNLAATSVFDALCPGAPIELDHCLFLDTETSGLSSGAGTIAFLVGFARVRSTAVDLEQYVLTRFAGETAMLAALEAVIAGMTVVSYNGKSFDVPLLTTRYRLAGQTASFNTALHLDLLAVVRRLFARSWPDCTLTTLERNLLGFVRPNDLPGAWVPQVWRDWLQRGDAARFPAVIQHNRWDLLAMVNALPTLDAALQRPWQFDADVAAVARWHGRGGRWPVARDILLATDQTFMARETLHELAALHRRNGDWAQAVPLWEQLAREDCPIAIEALAKFYEHRRGDYRTAFALTQRLPSGPARKRRETRLSRRLQNRCDE